MSETVRDISSARRATAAVVGAAMISVGIQVLVAEATRSWVGPALLPPAVSCWRSATLLVF